MRQRKSDSVDNLRKLYAQAGFRYDYEVAQATGMDKTAYSAKLRGVRSFTEEDISNIADALKRRPRTIREILFSE